MADCDFHRFRVGEVRRGQVLHTFGVGSIVDLPNISVMPLGLHAWDEKVLVRPEHRVDEERLLGMVQAQLGPQVNRLYLPPTPPPNANPRRDPYSSDATTGVPVVPFPRWGRCSVCNLLAPLDYGVFRLIADAYRPDRTKYVHHNCAKRSKPPAVVPARHVVACSHGHLEDFPWREFVHGGNADCHEGSLRFEELGLSSEVADLLVKCDGCGATKPMTGAFGKAGEAFFRARGCSGRHPHLGADHREECSMRPKVILAGATNLWFPVMVPAITIPVGGDGRLEVLVDDHWATLQNATEESHISALRGMGQLEGFGEWDVDAIWSAVQVRRSGAGGEKRRTRVQDLKEEEWAVLCDPEAVEPRRDFSIRRVPVPGGFENHIADVVLVDRIRVVRALTGFTRIDSPGNYGDVGALPDFLRAPLTRRAPEWVPATEVRGEGVFIRFDHERLERWADGLQAESAEMHDAHTAFRSAREVPHPEEDFPTLTYVVLHTLAHALIRQLSIECGYSAASIEERIYCSQACKEGPRMAGLLIYTAAPDSEGTLGGLVSLGEPGPLGRHLRTALGRLALCPSDPLCSEHRPTTELGGVLHGAACHSCTFVSETSCEAGNKYLDRSVLVRTVTGTREPFFPDSLVDVHV